jgi:MoxR-like ATPase
MLTRFKETNPLKELKPVTAKEELLAAQEEVTKVHVSDAINHFIVSIVRATRGNIEIALGGSPRATLCLFKAAQAWAFYNQRDFVIPDDVIKMAVPVLEHRLVLKQETRLKKLTSKQAVENILKTIRIKQ